MTQIAPIDSLAGFIEQQGVATSGDALAVLRCLSLNINAAMCGAVSEQDTRLNEQLLRLERIVQSRLLERLADGQRLGGYVGWTPDEAEALRLQVDALQFPAGLGPFEPLVRYQREVTMPDGTVFLYNDATTASQFSDWLTDYERSVNDLGQVVWTRVAEVDGGFRLTIVFTELETLQGVPEAQFDQLQRQVEDARAVGIGTLVVASNTLRFTLEEWWGDLRIDDRWHSFARHNEDRRVERKLDEMRQEITQLRAQLHSVGHEWPTLAERLEAQMQARLRIPIEGNLPETRAADRRVQRGESELSTTHQP